MIIPLNENNQSACPNGRGDDHQGPLVIERRCQLFARELKLRSEDSIMFDRELYLAIIEWRSGGFGLILDAEYDCCRKISAVCGFCIATRLRKI